MLLDFVCSMDLPYQSTKSVVEPIKVEPSLVVFRIEIIDAKLSSPNNSSITARTRCTFSSPICTNTEPLSVSRSRATVSRSRR